MDNYYKIGPAKMSDARIFTDYRTATTREEVNKHLTHIKRDDEYRMYLQNNANNILNDDWNRTKTKYSVPLINCVHVYGTSVDPKSFLIEREKYDRSFMSKQNMYPCEKYSDYRMTETNNTTCYK